MSHLTISVFSLVILVAGFIFVCISMPETLSPEAALKARLTRAAEMPSMDNQLGVFKYYILRPINDLMILNRNTLFRLMSALAFFSGVVGSADMSLFVYYVEENLEFNQKDIAVMFMIRGLLGIVVQTLILKTLNGAIGERRVIILAFFIGTVHNYIYGVAKTKMTFLVGSAIATFTSMSFPTISAIKANNVVSFIF